MFRPLFLFIGLRYTRASKRNHFISFISVVSMLGIAIGMTVLITVLSVMNGFDEQIKKRVFAMIPQVTVSGLAGRLSDWQSMQATVQKNPYVLGSAPYVNGEALLTGNGLTQAVLLTGIDPAQQTQVSTVGNKMLQGTFNSLTPDSFHIAIGAGIADRYGLQLGDKITVITPSGNMTPLGFIPRFKRFTVSAIFHAGNGFDFDNQYVFIALHDAQTLYQLGNDVSGVRLSITDPFRAPQLAHSLQATLPPLTQVGNWTDQFGAFFSAIALEKHMMFLILLLIIAVAAFNLVSTLVMVVNEKAADIAILRTLGATPKTILLIFVVQGIVVGLVGTVLGVIGGVLFSLNVTRFADFLQRVFHIQFISSSVYIVDYLPSHIETMDVVKIAIAALILSLLATVYPAYRAARVQIAEALRYE